MADSEANIRIDIDTSSALASIKNLQRQISAFHTQMQASGNAANAALSKNMQKSLVDSINATGKFSANLTTIKSTTESFTNALEKNKLSMGEYFRYAGASTKTFGRLFKSEFDTIDKVARERVKTLQTQYIKMGRDANGSLQAIKVRPIALDMQNLGTQTAMAAQKQALFNQLIKQGSTNLLNWGKNTQWAGRQLMVGFTIPLAMLGSIATKSFMELEKQAIRFKRVYGELFTTGAETEQAFKDVRKLADEFTKYGVQVEKTLALAADAAQMGLMGVALTEQVTNATRLAVLGEVEQQEALKTTISLTNAFGIAAEDLSEKIDFLNAVENQTMTAISDLTIAIPKAAPVVKQLGGNIEDLAFFLTAMREGGINASEGANALKSGLASLINPAEKSAKFLADLGINIQGIVESNKGDIKGTVIQFAQALDTLDPLNRARAIEQLFGKFQFSRLSTLFQNVIKDGSQAQKVLELTRATTEELAILSERELKRVEDSPAFKFQKSMEDLKTSLAPIGVEFVKLITPIIEFGTKLLKQFNDMGDGGKQFVTGLIAVLGLIAPAALMTIGLVANGIANLAKGFNSIRLFYQRLSGSSSQLAGQTQYLTSEQLEAAAVAASLQQSHARLTQTFTSESAAVWQLVAAYQAAIKAQLAMNAAAAGRRAAVAPPITRIPGLRRAQSPPGPIGGTPGYARGVVSVPGPKGAGDVVPAMLSPGEAVIPAKQAQKYSGIVSSLISDNVPGFRFGRNPFASMLGRSNVAVRMGSNNFISAIQSGGKNARYQSAFKTKTGADYLTKYGFANPRQRKARSDMERDIFGLDPKNTLASARPTYGYAKTSVLQSLINRLFGIKGKNFNALTMGPTNKSLAPYGDIDLITKSSVARRSSAYPNDLLMSYVRAKESGLKLNATSSRNFFQPAPMRGASADQLRSFDRLGTPFGSNLVPGTKNQYSTNPRSPYVETQTPGGFAFKEIDKIIARDRTVANQIKSELKAAGLGGIRVQGPGFISRLFKKLGVPGYMSGTASVPTGDGLDDLLIKARRSIRSETLAGRIETGFASQAEKYLSATDGVRRTIPRSLAIMEAASPGDGTALLKKIVSAKVTEIDAMKQMSMGADFAQKGPQSLKDYISQVERQLLETPKKKDGSVKSNLQLTKDIRKASGWTSNNAGARSLAHIGQGTKITARELLALSEQGKFNLRKEQIALLQSIDPDRLISIKTALGMDGFSQRVNAAMNGNGASKAAFLKDFDVMGPNKWNTSIRLSGGDIEALGSEARRFDPALRKAFADLPEGTLIVDSEDQVKNLAKDGRSRVSAERIFAQTRSKMLGATSNLIKTLDKAQTLPTEARSRDKDLEKEFRSPGKNRKVSGPAMPQLKEAAQKELGLRSSFAKLFGSGKAGSVRQLAGLFGRFRGFPMSSKIGGFANGVVSVPGPKGAGDVVPAMLSPGEAVIPAKMSKKYAPIISSMISDSIPGYDGGYDPKKDVFRTPSNNLGKPAFDPAPFGSQSSNFADDGISPNKKDFKQIFKDGSKQFGKNLVENAKAAGKNVGEKISDGTAKGWAKSKLGQAIAGPAQVVNAKTGNVVYDPKTDPKNRYFAGPKPETPTKTSSQVMGSSAAASGTAMSADEKKMATKEKFQRFGGRAMGIGMVGSTGALMAGMLPGEAGKTAQEMALPIMALSSMAMFIQGPVSGAIVALGAAIGGILFVQHKLNEAYKSGAEEAISLRTAIGGSTEAIRSMSEFAGTVTAGESADRRRQNKFQLIPIATGKTTFGESFIQGDQGQALLENLKKDVAISGGDTSSAYKQMAQQLKMSVISGALTEDQAGSIAAQVGAELGDASFGIKVRAEIQQLIGPNGENITENPLSIATKIGDESMAQMNTSRTAMQESLKTMPYGTRTQGQRDFTSLGIIAGSTVGGALIGAAIGSFVPVIGTAIGAIVGGIAGAIGGVVSTIVTMESQAKKAGALAGAYVADMTIALQNQTEIMDVLDQYYIKKLLEAEVEGDITEYKRLQEEYDRKKNALAEKAAEISKSIIGTLNDPETDEGTVEAITTGLKNAAAVKYKDDPNFALYQPLIDKTFERLNLSPGQEGLMRSQMLTEDLGPAALSSLLTTAESTKQVDLVVDIVTNLGGDTAGEMNSILNMIKDPKLKANLILNVSRTGTDEAAANDLLELALDVQALGGVLEQSVDVILSYILNNPEQKTIMNDLIDRLNSTEVNTVEQVYEIIPEFQVDGKWADAFNEEFFATLSTNAERETYIQAARTILTMPEPVLLASDDFTKWLAEGGAEFGPYPGNKYTAAQWVQLYADSEAQRLVNDGTSISGTVPPAQKKKTGGGGGPKGSWLDAVVKQTRDVAKATTRLTEGFENSLKAIQNFSKIGVSSLKGLNEQLRAANAPEEMISGLLGLNEKDFDKQYSKLFKKTKKGNTVLTDAGKDVRKTILKNAAAGFTDSNRATIKDLDNQNKAVRRLVGSGMSLSSAYAAVEDATLAAAVAGKQITDKQLKKMIASAKLAEDALKQFRDVSAVQESMAETNKLISATNALSKSKYSFAEQQAILSDSTLTDMFLSGKNEKLLKARIKQILTPEFLQGIFDEGFNAAMNAFTVKERKIELEFEAKMKADFNIVEAAQNEIAGIEYVIDDLQAGLREIENQEEKINESYDKRIKALDDIKDLNTDIANQQKGQISVAEALSRGDISSAAKAIQELRASQARSSIDSRRKALELSREKDLARLTSSNGKTRKELEEEIKKLQNDIFRIEEDRLEPAQRRVDLATIEKNELIASITVLGRTRTAWADIESAIDNARIGSESYMASITAAIAQVESLKKAWESSTPTSQKVSDIPEADDIPKSSSTENTFKGTRPGPDHDGKKKGEIWVGPEATWKWDGTKWNKISNVGKNNQPTPQSTGSNTGSSISSPSPTLGANDPNKGGLKPKEGSVRTFDTKTSKWTYTTAPKPAAKEGVAHSWNSTKEAWDSKSVPKPTFSGYSYSWNTSNQSWDAKALKIGSSSNPYTLASGLSTPKGGAPLSVPLGSFVKIPKGMHILSQQLKDGRILYQVGDSTTPNNISGKPFPAAGNLVQATLDSNSKIPDIKRYAKGGQVGYYPMGGLIPYKAIGGAISSSAMGGMFKTINTDSVPAMLTPGEFVMKRYAVESFGLGKMKAINNGTYSGESVYNYSVNVNVQTDANADQIARNVMTQIKRIDSQRIRGNRF
jgi:TP901 family phage tail tape measure protein